MTGVDDISAPVAPVWYYPESRGIYAVSHDAGYSILYVAFAWGDVRGYAGVSERTFHTLLTSRSVARYFSTQIVDRYPSCRL